MPNKKPQTKRILKISKSRSVPDIRATVKPSDPNIDKCALCWGPKRNPVEIQCLHTFCNKCYNAYLEERGWVAKKCPLCRRPLQLVKKMGLLKKMGLIGAFVVLAGVIFYSFSPDDFEEEKPTSNFWNNVFGNH